MGASTEFNDNGDLLKPVTANIKYLCVDQDYLSTFGVPVVAGRDFSRAYATDTNNFVLNVAATKALGVRNPGEMIGKNFSYGGTKGKVIGIMRDFNFKFLQQPIGPLILAMPPASQPASNSFHDLSIKLSGNRDNITEAVNRIGKTWKASSPTCPSTTSFLDERFEQLYITEQRQGQLFTVFSGIAIFIACLGLLGRLPSRSPNASKRSASGKCSAPAPAPSSGSFPPNFSSWSPSPPSSPGLSPGWSCIPGSRILLIEFPSNGGYLR